VRTRRRRTPYTAIGIRRVRCAYRGCRRTGYAQWAIAGEYSVACWIHDVELHTVLLEVLGDREKARKIAAYSAAVIRTINQQRRRR
jgi:hypothetical protein